MDCAHLSHLRLPTHLARAGGARLASWLYLFAGLVLLLGLVSGVGFLGLVGKYGFDPNEGWVDDTRLKMGAYSKPVVDDNGYDTYAKAAWAVTPTSMFARGDHGLLTSEESLALYLLVREANTEALGLFHEAADKSCVSPFRPQEDSGSYCSDLDVLPELATDEILLLHHEGNDREALQVARDGYAFAVNCTRWGSITDLYDSTWSAYAIQCTSIAVLIEGRLASRDYLAHAEYVRALRARIWPFSRVVRGELESARHVVSLAERRPFPSDLPLRYRVRWTVYDLTWDAAQSFEWIEDRYARTAQEADRPFGHSELDRISGRTENDLSARNDPVADRAVPDLGEAYHEWLRLHAYLIGEETTAALRAYQVDHGRYPETLNELAPEYLPEPPSDPWTGEPLKYRRSSSGPVLYAVGPDRRDNGGSRVPARNPIGCDDLVIAPPDRVPQP